VSYENCLARECNSLWLEEKLNAGFAVQLIRREVATLWVGEAGGDGGGGVAWWPGGWGWGDYFRLNWWGFPSQPGNATSIS